MILYTCIIKKINFMIKCKVNSQGHIQKFYDITSLRQNHDVASNVGFPVALQF